MADHVPDFSPGVFPPDPVTDPSMQPNQSPWPNHSPWPNRPPWPSPWPRPNYQYNHDRFVYATLTVLCFGSIALAVICWTCCRKNKGNVKSSETTIVTGNIVTLSEIPPPPPPYTSTQGLYESPPRYSGIYKRTEDILNCSEKGQNKEECLPCPVMKANNSPATQVKLHNIDTVNIMCERQSNTV